MSIGGRSLHKEDYLKLALIAAGTAAGFGVAGMGPMAGMFGAGAAGAGAGAAGAGAAAGGIGGGTAASLFGPTAAQAATLATYAPTAAAAGAGASTAGSMMGGGTAASMFGPAAEHAFAASLLPSSGAGTGLLGGANWGKGLETYQKIAKLQELAGGNRQEKPEPVQRPPVQPVPISDAVRYWQQIYGGVA